MNLRKQERCPIHGSYFCCGREQFHKQREFTLPVRRIEDPNHPRGYREIRSSAAMRILVKQKVHEQEGCCAICGEPFEDFADVVPDHRRSRGMGGSWRDDHPENIVAAHRWCNLAKGSRHAEILEPLSEGQDSQNAVQVNDQTGVRTGQQ